MEFEVVCVDHGIFPHGGSKIIRFGVREGGRIVVVDKQNMLTRMTRGDRFFVQRAGRKVFLVTGVSAQGNTFLETQADDTVLDNLMALPICTHNDQITFGTGVSEPGNMDGGSDGGEGDTGGGVVVEPGDSDS